MLPRSRIIRWSFPLVLLAVLASNPSPVRAQTLDEGWDRLEGKYRSVHNRVIGFLKGTERVDPSDRSQLEALDLLAKTYTYKVYLNKVDESGGIHKDFVGFEKDIDGILQGRDRQALQSLADVLRERVRTHALEVIQLKEARPIHKLYNARVLAKIAELGEPALAGTLVTVLNDREQNAGVQYYILQAMGTLLAQVQQPQATPLLSKDQQAKCAEAIVTFLEQKKGPAKNAPPDEIDGFRILRREAVRALAKIHTPAFSDKVRPALVLAQFAGNDEHIQPLPRIDERLEAAIGLARMDPGKDKRYQADYAAGQIAKCLGEFAYVVSKERANKEASAHPWRIYAAQLRDGLEALKRINGKNMYVGQVSERATGLLKRVIEGAVIEGNELTWWRSPQSDPPSKELFQGSPDSSVKPAQPSDEEGTEK